MKRVNDNIAESRTHTDASLGAERADNDRTAAREQRVRDDIIDRDRLLADARLLKFRDSVDRTLARDRSASSSGKRSVDTERAAADAGTTAERLGTDALLQQERQQADAAVATDRSEHTVYRAAQARRHVTDDQLLMERQRADDAVAALHETTDALAIAEDERARAGDVLAMVTHDLRSPLSIITWHAESIAADSAEPATAEMAHEVVLAASRMARLVTDLLDVVRIDAGTLRIVKAEHDVGTLLAEVLESYRPLFSDRGLTFNIELPAGAIVASFDHDRIVQVLSNLLGNAMKFTPAGGNVALHAQQRAGEVEFILRDDGPGIHPTVVPQIFRRFSQIDSNSRRGLGLGLYICDIIVKAHGGRIWVDSEFGKGATFRFTLPNMGGLYRTASGPV